MKILLVICAVLMALPCIALAAPIPDTGQTKCYDNTQEITCPNLGEDFYGQDAQYGPNIQSFTKLDANGNDLPDEATEWFMVRDNKTGLIWENKTDDGSIHDKDNTYNWYDAQDVFIAALNSQNFGGCSDWRLPTIKELSSLVDSSIPSPVPTINTIYFLNTHGVSGYSAYWSFTAYAGDDPRFAWAVDFADGRVHGYWTFKDDDHYVRAVRGGQTSNNFIDNGDGTITDMDTGLMWEVKTDDGGPRDKDNLYTWQQALSYCENLSLGGYSDWRLPNRNELQSIVDYNRHNPSIDPIFSYTKSSYSYYFSSTTYASWLGGCWLVIFDDGSESGGGGKSDGYVYYVRAVRGCHIDDDDCDDILNENDNCPHTYNPGQEDIDLDTIGDACDNCTNIINTGQEDADGDYIGNACDNCPNLASQNREDTDGSGIGNVCNDAIDADGDEWEDSLDNCPNFASQNQQDTDLDGTGDICDPCPNDYDNDIDLDSMCGDIDNCPSTPNGSVSGACVKVAGGVVIGTGATCLGYEDCGELEYCDMIQGDVNSNEIGDACECYADVNCSTKVDLADLVIMKGEFLHECPCQADCNGDNQVNLGDLVIMKAQFLRSDCPVCP